MTAERTPRIVVRDASEGEMERVRQVTRSAYQEYARVMDPISWRGLREAVEEGLANSRDAEIIVAELNGSIVGSVMLFPPAGATYGGAVDASPWPEIRLLAVSPSARGRGISRLLVSECLERARSRGYRGIGLHTSRSMTIAVEMYRRMGFVRTPEYDFQPPSAERVEAYTLSLVEEPKVERGTVPTRE